VTITGVKGILRELVHDSLALTPAQLQKPAGDHPASKLAGLLDRLALTSTRPQGFKPTSYGSCQDLEIDIVKTAWLATKEVYELPLGQGIQ
jgi:hypothetical protein